MFQALHIVAHAIRQVIGNLGSALRVSALPFAAQLCLLLLILPQGMVRAGEVITPGRFWLVFLGVLVVVVGTTLVIAVTWHRFVLGGGAAGLIPRLPVRDMAAYLVRALLIALIALLATAPLMMFMGAGLTGHDPWLTTLVLGVVGTILTALVLRLSVSLPALAIGRRMSLAEGWAVLEGHLPALATLAVILVLAQVALAWVVSLVAIGPLLATGAAIGANWLALMVWLSVLTTLYGHYVEGRPLA